MRGNYHRTLSLEGYATPSSSDQHCGYRNSKATTIADVAHGISPSSNILASTMDEFATATATFARSGSSSCSPYLCHFGY
jgi:hypothetical protein